MRRILLTVAISFALVLTATTPASAHTVSGVAASNYQTRLMSLLPKTPGIEARVVEIGSRLQLTNTTGDDVIVQGYQQEPYLRVGPAGVFENRRSPATYLNASRKGGTPIPGSADAKAAPEWVKVSDGHVATWHDHRIHWMSNQDPPDVRRAPGSRHVVFPEWTIPMTVGGHDLVATGDLVWVPAPSPLPWLALGIGLLAGVATLGLSRSWATALAVVVALLVAADVVHAFGIGFAKAGPTGTKIAQVVAGSFYSLVAWAVGGIAVWRLSHRRLDGLPAAGFTGLFIALFGGLADYVDLTRSQIPFAWGGGFARLLVTVSVGAGLGLVGAAVIGLRRNPRRREAAETP